MQRFRERVATMPLVWLFLFMALFFGVFTWLVGQLTVERGHVWIGLGGHLIGGLVFGGLMIIFVARQRRRLGHPRTGFAIERALKTGTVPDGIDTEEWLTILGNLSKQSRFYRPILPIGFGLFTVLELAVAIFWKFPIFYAFATMFVVMLAFSLTVYPRQLKRIDVLEAKLRDPHRLSSETSGDLHP